MKPLIALALLLSLASPVIASSLSDWFAERPSGHTHSPSSLVAAWGKADDKTKATTLRPVLLAQAGPWSADLTAMAATLPRNDRMRLEDAARALASAAKDKTKADEAIRALARIQGMDTKGK